MKRHSFLSYAVAGIVVPVYVNAKPIVVDRKPQIKESGEYETIDEQISRIYNQYMQVSAERFGGWYPDTSFFDYFYASILAKERGITESELRLDIYSGLLEGALRSAPVRKTIIRTYS